MPIQPRPAVDSFGWDEEVFADEDGDGASDPAAELVAALSMSELAAGALEPLRVEDVGQHRVDRGMAAGLAGAAGDSPVAPSWR